VQDQPVVRIAAERLRNDLVELGLDLVGSLAAREAGAVADAEHMGVDCERLLAPRGVEHDIGGLAADPGERLELVAGARDLAVVALDQRFAQGDDVLRLGVEQADGLDRVAQGIFAEIDHLPRRLDPREERARGDIDAGVGGLRR